MILYKNNYFLVKKIESIRTYILVIPCQIYSLELRMILVYMSVTNYDGNNQLIQYVQEHIEILRIKSFWVILMAIQVS